MVIVAAYSQPPAITEAVEFRRLKLTTTDQVSGNVSPLPNTRIRLTDRSTSQSRKNLEDLTIETDSNGVAIVPAYSEGAPIHFALKVESDQYFLPELRMMTKWDAEELTLNLIELQKIKGHVEISGTQDSGSLWSAPVTATVLDNSSWDTRPMTPMRTAVHSVQVPSDGHFEIRIPRGKNHFANLTLTSPGLYTEYFFLGHNQAHPKHISIADVVSHPLRIRMEPAPIIVGHVSQPGGDPFPDVHIKATPKDIQFFAVQSIVQIPETRTDQRGDFRLPIHFRGDHSLTANQGISFVESTTLTSLNEQFTWNIRFHSPGTISGKAVDADGRPVPNAIVRSAKVGDSSQFSPWSTRTDIDGHFIWDSAPRQTIQFLAQRPGVVDNVYAEVDLRESDTSEVTIQFGRPFQFRYHVIDSLSLNPVENLSISLGTARNQYLPEIHQWRAPFDLQRDEGLFVYTSSEVLPSPQRHKLLFTAPGYLPFESDFLDQDQILEGTIALDRGHGPHGIILDAQGLPVPDCTVFMTGLGSYQIQKSGAVSFFGSPPPPVTHSLNDGSFSLPASLAQSMIVAIHNRGFASAHYISTSSQEPFILNLSPLATLRGVLKKSDGSPWSGIELKLAPYISNDPFAPRLTAGSHSAITDENGAFEMQELPPIRARILQSFHLNDVPMGGGFTQSIDLAQLPPEPLILGHFGTTATAHLDIPQTLLDNFEYHFIFATISEPLPEPSPKIRSNPRLLNIWRNSSHYLDRQANITSRVADASQDGSLVFHNLPKGDYILRARIYKQNPKNARAQLETVLSYQQEIHLTEDSLPTVHLGRITPGNP